MIWLPPISTLFPYTTLFRSDAVGARQVRQPPPDLEGPVRADVAAVGDTALSDEREPPAPDRKSTRLNSSHLGNSYAVFCLKKKNKITRSTTSTLKTTHRYSR